MTDLATTDTSAVGTDAYVPTFKKETRRKESENEDLEFSNAKAFLSTKSIKDGSSSLYDHLTSVVSKILETKAPNAFDSFESISAHVKKLKFKVDDHSALFLKNVPEPSQSLLLSQAQASIFTYKKTEEKEGEPGEIPDIMDLSTLWDWAGISFGKEETFVLLVSLKKLVDEKPIKSVRLWGKIFGTSANYIVVEAELKDGINDEEDAIANPKPAPEKVTDEVPAPASTEETEKSLHDEYDAPKPKQKSVPSLPLEVRAGVNKYVYYVCHYAGGEWTRLPDVIPEKLQIARKIRKHFTGNLKQTITSYPVFNGAEAQYLRCQIARISGSTVVSPAGYYMPDPEEAEGEGSGGATIIINTEYEGLPSEQLLNTANWVHHVPYILPQGRMSWENPYTAAKAAEGEEEEEEKEDKDEDEADPAAALEPETGPAMLTPLNSEDENGNVPSWVSRLSSQLSPSKFSPIVLRSTRWPGATVVSYNDKFANVYIGDGLKDLGNPIPKFAPPLLPPIQSEYTTEEGLLTEQLDPTIEAEAALEAEKRAKEEANKVEEGGDEPEEEEE